MPLELAPFFFGTRGEIMLATIALIQVYPLAADLMHILVPEIHARQNRRHCRSQREQTLVDQAHDQTALAFGMIGGDGMRDVPQQS